MRALSSAVLRHRLLVGAFWLLALLAGAATAGTTTERLTFDFSLPGQPGYEAEARLLAAYGNGGTNAPVLPVVTVPEGSTVQERAGEVAAVFQALRTRFPQARVVDLATARDPIVYLGSFAAVVGALVGALVGGVINGKRRDRC